MGSLFTHVTRRHFASQINHEDAAERISVLDALEARRDTDLLLKKALDLLSDPEPDVRNRAAQAIASLGTKEAAEATIEAWESFSEDGLSAAIDALAGIGREAVVATRKQIHHTDGAIRAAAATVLGRVDARTVVGDLAAALADPEPRVVCAAARALGRHRAEQCIDDLAVVYRRKPACRAAVVDGLEAIGTPAAERHLRKALHDEDEAVREHARAALQRVDAR